MKMLCPFKIQSAWDKPSEYDYDEMGGKKNRWGKNSPILYQYDFVYDIYRVGTSEKGSLTLELSVSGVPGHSSMPEGETTIATLARAITRYPRNKIAFICCCCCCCNRAYLISSIYVVSVWYTINNHRKTGKVDWTNNVKYMEKTFI